MVTGGYKRKSMKRLFSIVTMLFVSFALFAQSDVTKFLGIPVDGFKPDMIRALKAKGFVSTRYDQDILEGEFNGTQVNVHTVTNNNKVCRIMVCDANSVDEIAIKIRFNRLCDQFTNNKRYMAMSEFKIPDNEDISYQMNVNNKRYEALFYQSPDITDTLALQNDMRAYALTKYTEEQLANPTEEIQEDIMKMAFDFSMQRIAMKPVWFMISEHYGKYYITMFYDNEYNRANGEDL